MMPNFLRFGGVKEDVDDGTAGVAAYLPHQ